MSVAITLLSHNLCVCYNHYNYFNEHINYVIAEIINSLRLFWLPLYKLYPLQNFQLYNFLNWNPSTNSRSRPSPLRPSYKTSMTIRWACPINSIYGLNLARPAALFPHTHSPLWIIILPNLLSRSELAYRFYWAKLQNNFSQLYIIIHLTFLSQLFIRMGNQWVHNFLFTLQLLIT